MTAPTTQIALKNNTGSSVAYAYVTGLDINKDNAYAFLQPDGKTMYYPQSPPQSQQPLAVDCATPPGTPRLYDHGHDPSARWWPHLLRRLRVYSHRPRAPQHGRTNTNRPGPPYRRLDQVCAQLTAQGASENPAWGKLVVKGPDGKNLRALSPNAGRIGKP
ncbi:hypothetical protein NUW58_g10249 [Xylaria curta]|uniref:Uncharacterized protein n=1 Tax=Xylaria curta TaxID=42375 RepID=A0ACC1MQ21_9PEZI|nr:hypothetical protein NUW58_g10249 [Xylaria curta]